LREKKKILSLIRRGVTDKEIKKVNDFTENYGGLDAATEYIGIYAEKARQDIADIKTGPAKTSAMNFIDYIINRKR
jgi:geranylgeranyl pyrophosphate synthase